MVRRLDMDKTQGIEQLFATGMSRRQIARTLGVNRRGKTKGQAQRLTGLKDLVNLVGRLD